MKILYSIFDNKSKSYGPVFSVPHDAVATREFGGAVSNEQSALSKYPDDFELHALGVFHDDGNGEEHPVVGQGVRVVITARQWVDAQFRSDKTVSLEG